MFPCRLIVCEKTSHFAPALRRELIDHPSFVVETRSLPGCLAALAESPESLIAIEVTPANLESAITFIEQVGRRYPQSSTVALVDADTLPASNLLAEAGAIAVFTSVLESSRLAQLAQRKLAQATKPELTLPEFINQRLPWPAFAS